MTPRPLLSPPRRVLLSLGPLVAIVLAGCGEARVPPSSRGLARSPAVVSAEHEKPTPDPTEPPTVEVAATAEMADQSGTTEPASVDLLAWIDPERDAVAGQWAMKDGALISPGTVGARLVIPCTVPDKYRLKVVVERVGGDEMFGIGLVAGGRRFMANFDSHYEDRISSGLELVGGQRIPENATTRLGRVFDKGEPTTIVATVNDGHIRVTADGEELVDYQGSLQNLSLAKNWKVPGEGKLFLASWKCRYRITALELTALSGERPMLAVAPVVAPVPTGATPDEAGAGKTVKLADGTVLQVPSWEETYQAYEFRPPLWGDDWRRDDSGERIRGARKAGPGIETVYDARRDNGGSDVYAGSIELAPERQILYWIVWSGGGPGWLIRLDLRGSRPPRTLIDLDGEFPGGLALDLQRGKIYWSVKSTAEGGKIQRANLDGSHVEDVIVGCAPLGIVVDSRGGCFYYSFGGRGTGSSLLRVSLDGGLGAPVVRGGVASRDLTLDHRRGALWLAKAHRLCRVELDGSDPTTIFDRKVGDVWGVAVDEGGGKVYWVDHDYGNLRRANHDGSMVEDLAVGLPNLADLALDLKHGYVYWTESYSSGRSLYPRVRRMKIPPPLEPVTKPAPPQITSFSPGRQTPGDQVTLSGKHFKGTTKVVFVGAPAGERAEAEFRVKSDHELTVTVPRLGDGCTEAAILVLGPGGLTATLPTELCVVAKWKKFDLFEKDRPFVFWVTRGAPTGEAVGLIRLVEVSHSLVYVAPGGFAYSSLRGQNTILLKNRAVTAVSAAARSVIYYEPFAIVNQRDELPESSRLVAVPAIRPSFVKELLQYQSRIRPHDGVAGE